MDQVSRVFGTDSSTSNQCSYNNYEHMLSINKTSLHGHLTMERLLYYYVFTSGTLYPALVAGYNQHSRLPH